jgi:hypothetical protein
MTSLQQEDHDHKDQGKKRKDLDLRVLIHSRVVTKDQEESSQRYRRHLQGLTIETRHHQGSNARLVVLGDIHRERAHSN